MSKVKKKSDEQYDITRDYSLMNQISAHIGVYGFTSIIENVIATCEDNIRKWEERLNKAKKMRKSLGDNWGQN